MPDCKAVPFFIARIYRTDMIVETIVNPSGFETREAAEETVGRPDPGTSTSYAIVEAVDAEIAALRAQYAATERREPPGGWDRYQPFINLGTELGARGTGRGKCIWPS
jgi:hypothetical protein